MQYFAIGEDNGGAGERRLGPFDTAEEAQAAGQKETKESNGAFVFRGVVDEANNQVGMDIEPVVTVNSIKNATTMDIDGNALKIGDAVLYERSPGNWVQDVIKRIDEGGSVYLSRSPLFGRDASTSLIKNVVSTNSVRTTCPVVANAITANRRVVANASNKFDNTPIDKFVRDNICSKYPEANLEGYTNGAVKYWTKGNGNKTILADKTARPSLDVLKSKFEADYVITPVDYGRGATGFTMKPRAHASRGEFKVQNALAANRRVARNAEEDNYYLSAKKSIEEAGKLLASAIISLSRSKAPNAEAVHADLTKMGDMFERIRKRI